MKRNMLLFSGYPFLVALFLVPLFLLLSAGIDYSAMIVSVLALYLLALVVMYIIYGKYLKQEFWDNKIIRGCLLLSILPIIYCIAVLGKSVFEIAFYSLMALSVLLISLNFRNIAFFTMTVTVILKVYLLTQEYFGLLTYALTPYHIAYIARDISLVFLLLAAIKKHGNVGRKGYRKFGFIAAFYIFAELASHILPAVIPNEVLEVFQSAPAVSASYVIIALGLALLDGGMGKDVGETEEIDEEKEAFEVDAALPEEEKEDYKDILEGLSKRKI